MSLLVSKYANSKGCDSLSRAVTEPHPTHVGLNVFARDKDGNVKARLCAIDAGLTLFDESNNVVWAK